MTNMVTRTDHAHFVSILRTKWVLSARETKIYGVAWPRLRPLFEIF